MIDKLNQRLLQALHNTKLKKKLLLTYFVLIIIPLWLFYFLSYSKMSAALQKHTAYSAEQSFNQTFDFLSYKLYKIINVSDVISLDQKTNAILSTDMGSYDTPSQVEDMNELIKFLTSFQDTEDIIKVRLYVRSGLIYSRENRTLFDMNDSSRDLWYRKLMSFKGKVLCCPSSYVGRPEDTNKEVLSLARVIKDRNNYSHILALLRLDIDKQKIKDIMAQANSTKDSLTYLVNSEGVVVNSSSDELLRKYYAGIEQMSSLPGSKGAFAKTNLNNESVLSKAATIPQTDWTMVTVIPYSSIIEESSSLQREILLMILLISMVAYAVAYYISHSITKRISQLIFRMREVQNGKLDALVCTNDKDEIGELFQNYNFMINRISSLLKEQYKTGQELKSAELKALQSQINPHFLYNTLDMINWLSHKNRISEIDSVVRSLAKFYKLSLSKGNDIISIRDELQHVTSYIHIQNIRFMNRIHAEVDVPDELADYSIPKITLQPIVENSILHGILEKEKKEGTIIIKGRMKDDRICLTVEDDGVGMPEEKLQKILRNEAVSEKGNSYGISNVNQRIRLFFGEDFGLSFKSACGKGTTVEINIPPVKMEQP